MSQPVRAACALLALMVLVTGCGSDSKSTAYPIPPLAAPGEDSPSAEVSPNLALALGRETTVREIREGKVPRELVGDRGNAVYSGQRLTGSVTAPAAASTRSPSAPAAPPAPVLAEAPPAVPRIPVEQQSATPPTATPPIATPPASSAGAAPSAPTTNLSGAGRVTVQLAAFRTRANAEGGWQRLRAAHPDQLGDRALIMREADLGDRGIYYRVSTGPFANVAAAKAFCAQLRVRDQACVVKRAQ